jgi:sugar lactone lactonase YvrE
MAQNQECSLPLPGHFHSTYRPFNRKRSWIPALAALLLVSASAWAQNGVFSTAVAVGVASAPQSVTVTAQAAGAVSTVEVLTMGASGQDFTVGSGTPSCVPGLQLTAGVTTCTESVTFTPTAPGVRMGAVVLLDSSNNVLGTAYLSGIGSGGLGVLLAGNLLPVAGDGAYLDLVVDNISATKSELFFPSGVTVDGAGNLYIADTNHNRIRMVCGKALIATIAGTTCTTAGNISTIAGGDTGGYEGDSGSAASAFLDLPSGLALDGTGNLYIADTGNSVIRKITAATGIISTVAGNGTAGFGGDASLATSGQLYKPQGVAVDASGNLYIADTDNQRIRRVDAATGIISTVAGNGAAGFGGDTLLATSSKDELNFPDALAFDSLGNLYIADLLNNRIRKVSSAGIMTTFAGTGGTGNTGDGGSALLAELDAPSGVAVDPAGNVYIADTQNNSIRKVSSSTGDISAIVSGAVTYYDNGAFSSVTLDGPVGLFLDSSANLYIADSLKMVVRELQSNFVALDFKTPIRQGGTSATQDQTVENDGNAPLTLTTPDISIDPKGSGVQGFVNAELDTTATTCPTSTNPFLATVDATCVIGAIFAPDLSLNFNGAASMPLVSNIYVGTAGDTVNSPLDIELVGTADALNSTTVVVTSTPNPSDYGQKVTFTATVTTGAGTGALTGTVTFYDGPTTLASNVALGTGGAATYTTSTLTVGSHTITATYSGDPSHFKGTSENPVTQVVNEATATSLASSANPSVLGASVTFTATVTTPSGGGVALPLTDTVTFTDTTTATTLCTVPLTLTGTTYSATCTTAALPQGQNSIIATYSGNPSIYILGSTSATLTQDVQAASPITLNSNSNPSYYGNPVIFTVTVPTVGPLAATGTVSILEAGQTPLIGTATLSGNPATGTFKISSLPVGTDVITASYPGDVNYGVGASNTVSQVVNQATTATAVSSIPSTGIAGGAEAITATVTVTQGVSTPTGNVTFMDGATSLGSVPLASTLSGTATATVSPKLALGAHSIVATYAGDTDDAGSSGSLPLNVVQATTKTTLSTSGTPALVLSAVTFTATVASVGGGVPIGAVTFTDTFNGATVTLPCAGALTPGATTATATCSTSALAAGTHTITATYSADTNDVTSSNSITQVVGLIPTLTGLGSSTTGSGVDAQLVLVATVINYSTTTQNASALPTPTGTVTFTSGTTTVGSAPLDSTGVATLIPASLPSGSFTIVATYSGDTYHSASSSVATIVDNPASGFTLTVTPPSVTIATTKNTTVNVALNSISGFTDTIGLGCASLPAGVTCHFSTPSATLTADGTVNVTLTIDTNNPLGGGSSAMNLRPAGPDSLRQVFIGNRSASLAGLFLPLSVFFGCIFWRFRKRYAKFMTMALILFLGGAALLVTGCGGFSQSSATPGTYVIQVTGTGANSNISRYQNVTLVISAK